MIGEKKFSLQLAVIAELLGVEEILDFIHLRLVNVEKSGCVSFEAAAVWIEREINVLPRLVGMDGEALHESRGVGIAIFPSGTKGGLFEHVGDGEKSSVEVAAGGSGSFQ